MYEIPLRVETTSWNQHEKMPDEMYFLGRKTKCKTVSSDTILGWREYIKQLLVLNTIALSRAYRDALHVLLLVAWLAVESTTTARTVLLRYVMPTRSSSDDFQRRRLPTLMCAPAGRPEFLPNVNASMPCLPRARLPSVRRRRRATARVSRSRSISNKFVGRSQF